MARRSKSAGAAAPAPAPALAKKSAPALPVAAASPLDPGKVSKAALHPVLNAAGVVAAYGSEFGQLEMDALVLALSDSIKNVQSGDMSRAEAMLFAQATALQTIFTNFSRRALNQEYQSHLESFFRMALKAQNQARMTLETLATLKNPQVVFAKQANINNGGQQQVNNGTQPSAAPASASREEKPVVQPNELLEASDGQWLDPGAKGQAGRADQVLEAVGQVHRPEDGGRQGQLRAKRL